MVTNRTAEVNELSVFFREAGDPESPKLLLLGGFPASSHQFRNLMPALADRFHVLSPDYPGFGNTDMPDGPSSTPSTASPRSSRGCSSGPASRPLRALYAGLRRPHRQPHHRTPPGWLEWQVIQNSNAYEEGFTSAWDAIRDALWQNRSPETEEPLEAFLQPDGVKLIYTHGHRKPELICPDNWNMDLYFLERPRAPTVQLDLFYDYRTNVEFYPRGRPSCASGSRRRSSSGDRTTSSSPPKAAGLICATCPRPSCTCSTAVTLPSRTHSTRSPGSSSASTKTRSTQQRRRDGGPTDHDPMRVLSVQIYKKPVERSHRQDPNAQFRRRPPGRSCACTESRKGRQRPIPASFMRSRRHVEAQAFARSDHLLASPRLPRALAVRGT